MNSSLARNALRSFLFYWFVAFAVAAQPVPENATNVLRLADAKALVSAWQHVRVLYDADRTVGIEQAIAQLDKFERPGLRYSTLGVRKEAAWLHVPLEIDAASDGHWIADIDYPPLNFVDVYLVRDGKVRERYELGSLRAFESRPLLARSHAVPVEVTPGGRYDLLIRVDTRGAMILPFTLEKPSAFHATAVREQLLQGLLIGIALCLLFYSLSQYASTRERLFVKYAMLLVGSLTFTLLQLGIGAQYVWTNNVWLETHLAGLSSMLAIAGTFLFLEESLRDEPLQASGKTRWFTLLMKGGASIAAVIALLHALDVISLRNMAIIVTLMGPLPSILATPKMIRRARGGDPVGWYLLFAFTVYMASVVVITGVIRGYMPVNFWTLHSFQFGATFDMLAFMYVLTLRTKSIRLAAQHASRERDIMRALAHTDPLTGLANRRSLSDALSAALARCSDENLLAVYVIDLDNFKAVNDSLGHDAGDELLVIASKRLQAAVRGGDIVSRLGGDEFVILASGLRSKLQAEELGNNLLRTFEEPVQLGAHNVNIALTIGYAIAPHQGKDSMTVLKLADDAMYAGKQSGKACLRAASVDTNGNPPEVERTAAVTI